MPFVLDLIFPLFILFNAMELKILFSVVNLVTPAILPVDCIEMLLLYAKVCTEYLIMHYIELIDAVPVYYHNTILTSLNASPQRLSTTLNAMLYS